MAVSQNEGAWEILKMSGPEDIDIGVCRESGTQRGSAHVKTGNTPHVSRDLFAFRVCGPFPRQA